MKLVSESVVCVYMSVYVVTAANTVMRVSTVRTFSFNAGTIRSL